MQASPGSQLVLDNAERYGLYLASSLNGSNGTQVLSRGNIGMHNNSGCNAAIIIPKI